jgi:hypothetical protein
MRLREIASLLPYHTHVDPAVVVSSLNRIIDDAAAGRTVFHAFYTAAEMEAEPSRRNTTHLFSDIAPCRAAGSRQRIWQRH